MCNIHVAGADCKEKMQYINVQTSQSTIMPKKKKKSDITITYLLKRDILMKEKTWVMSLRMKKEGTYMQIV